MKYRTDFEFLEGDDRINWLLKETPFGEFLEEDFGRKLLYKLEDMAFFSAPASTKYHGNYAEGLFEHSFAVMDTLVQMTKELDLHWDMKRSPVIVGLLHDLCKVDQYKYDPETNMYVYSEESLIKGHGIKSVVYIQQYLHIDLTEEETACILYHMGAFTDSKEWNNYNRAIQKYPNVLWTHTADMVASQIMGV